MGYNSTSFNFSYIWSHLLKTENNNIKSIRAALGHWRLQMSVQGSKIVVEVIVVSVIAVAVVVVVAKEVVVK